MSETEDFKSDINHKKFSESIGFPPSSHVTSSSIISGNLDNPIIISDSDGDEDFILPTAKETERRQLNRAVKEEPKDNVLKLVPVKRNKILNPPFYQYLLIYEL